MFDYLDPYAVTCGEVSSISKDGDAAGRSRQRSGHRRSEPRRAVGRRLFRENRRARAVLRGGWIDHRHRLASGPEAGPRGPAAARDRGEPLRGTAGLPPPDGRGVAHGYRIRVPLQRPAGVQRRADGPLPPASLVINATGMGKDLPGSPITDRGLFPMRGIAWELNYRGELQFLHQALAQRETPAGASGGRLAIFPPRLDPGDRGSAESPDRRAVVSTARRVAGAICQPALPASFGGR